MTFVIVMDFHQIIVVMNDVKRHTYIHTYICISVLSVHPYIYLPVYLYICLSVYLYILISIYLFIFISIYLFMCTSIYLFICIYVYYVSYLSNTSNVEFITFCCQGIDPSAVMKYVQKLSRTSFASKACS